MLSIRSMQVLFKQSALMQSLMTHKTKIKLLVNGMYTYNSIEVPVKEKLAVWGNEAITVDQLPKGMNNFNLQFYFYKNNEEVGRARCIAVGGRNRKDCLDIASRDFQIVGKFLFQTVWKAGIPQQVYNYSPTLLTRQALKTVSKYPELQEYEGKQSQNQYTMYAQNPYNASPYQSSLQQYRPPDLNKPYFKTVDKSQTQSEIKPKKNSSVLGMLGGCFGCVGVMRYKKKKPFFVAEPIVMGLNDLPYAAPKEQEPFSIQYYSKPLPSPQKS